MWISVENWTIPPIRIARERHPNAFICPITGGTHVIGNPTDVIGAIATLAVTTTDKNLLFGLGDNYLQRDKD